MQDSDVIGCCSHLADSMRCLLARTSVATWMNGLKRVDKRHLSPEPGVVEGCRTYICGMQHASKAVLCCFTPCFISRIADTNQVILFPTLTKTAVMVSGQLSRETTQHAGALHLHVCTCHLSSLRPCNLRNWNLYEILSLPDPGVSQSAAADL